jgi:hypothetical protein
MQAENPTGLRDRAAFLAIAAGASGVLTTARWLVPDARGFGTHVQLGLPPCAFQAFTSLPCPGCGLTTAFAHMVRAQWSSALHASPVGVILCALTVAAVPLSLWASVRAWSLSDTCVRWRISNVGLAMTALAFAQWSIRVALIAFR